MAGLAGLAIEKGFKVTGQDKAYYPPMSDQLKCLGIKENKTEDVINDIKDCDVVIIGNSQSRGNKAVEFILDNNLDYYSGPEWIKDNILKDKFVFVVSGTHGKTTTTSMLIKILQENNCNPSFLLGGIYKEDNISYKNTESEYFIIEGDEYDTAFFDKRSKFFHYKPNTLIINNLEYDHSDIFEDINEIKKQFHFLIRTMPNNTNIIYNDSDENISSLLSMGFWANAVPYEKNIKIKNIIGQHNLNNASAAISAANTIGISKENSILALKKFKGVKRRLEKIDNKNFILYDDFAHHPTEINSSLKTLRDQYPEKKIITFFEIRSNSMIAGTHKNAFLESFKDTDELYIYCNNNIDWLNKEFNKIFYKDLDIVTDKILACAGPKDVVVLMSNGDTSYIIDKLNNKT